MIKWLRRRRLRKQVRHVLREAQHARNMRGDLAAPGDLQELEEASRRLRRFLEEEDYDRCRQAASRVQEAISVVRPARPRPRLRENFEVMVVALAVAMGVRTYFVQPFKIPTGSMHPTLYGITYQPRDDRGWSDYPPFNIVKIALFGQRYADVRAQTTGRIQNRYRRDRNQIVIYINDRPHVIPTGMKQRFKFGEVVSRGQVLASGIRTLGDQVFVNKIAYNFRRPRRGDIFVFDTRSIKHPQIELNTFYIKRLAGMPEETISIDPPYLLTNGERLTEPYPFRRLLEDAAYNGYRLGREDARPPPLLLERSDSIHLGPDEYFPLGDNTDASLDGRYFGAVSQRDIVGPAFAVYWPISRRTGPVR